MKKRKLKVTRYLDGIGDKIEIIDIFNIFDYEIDGVPICAYGKESSVQKNGCSEIFIEKNMNQFVVHGKTFDEISDTVFSDKNLKYEWI